MGINVTNLVKEYGPQRAVDDISFQVNTGDILGFLGPNGAGKSTTMKIITCYLSPTAGNVTLDGYNIHDHSREVRQLVGYLPENTPLYTDMSIYDYLTLSAKLQEVPEDDIPPRIRSMIDVCGLGPERHKYIGELSKGYRQRVGLAQALIHDPDVLILDEPTTGLDPNQIVEIRSLIKEIGKEKTVMLSSHILKEVEATCDRIIIIDEGTLVADDSTQALRRKASSSEQLRIQVKTQTSNGDPQSDGKDNLDDQVEDQLLKLSSVAGVNPAGENSNSWIIDSKPDHPSREEVFNLCVERNWILLEMTPIESSLEDIFRDLTIK